MQYCNKSLIKNNNEILQYFNKDNDIALVMHQRALLDMSDHDQCSKRNRLLTYRKNSERKIGCRKNIEDKSDRNYFSISLWWIPE